MPEIPEMQPYSATPVVVEKDKTPELAPHTSAIDRKQRAASAAVDLVGGTATLNVIEGEEIDGEFIAVKNPQVTIDLKDLWKAMANKTESALPAAFAQFVLDTVTAEK